MTMILEPGKYYVGQAFVNFMADIPNIGEIQADISSLCWRSEETPLRYDIRGRFRFYDAGSGPDAPDTKEWFDLSFRAETPEEAEESYKNIMVDLTRKVGGDPEKIGYILEHDCEAISEAMKSQEWAHKTEVNPETEEGQREIAKRPELLREIMRRHFANHKGTNDAED